MDRTIEHAPPPPLEIRKDINVCKIRTLVTMSYAFVGPTSIGKTRTCAEVLTKIFGDSWILVRNINDLDRIKPYTRAILFDDISWQFREPEQLIHLTDPYYPCTIRILRRAIKIDSEIIKLFTHNSVEAYKPLLCQREQEAAITRRLTILNVQEMKPITIMQHLKHHPQVKKHLSQAAMEELLQE